MSPVRRITKELDPGPAFTNSAYFPLDLRRPFGQELDLSLLAFDAYAMKIVRSVDDGGTYAAHCEFIFPGAVISLAHLPDGEVAVGVDSTDAGGGPSIWRSTGWKTPQTARFDKTLQFAQGIWLAYGGFSASGNKVMVSEYGPQTDVAASGGHEAAKRAYLSKDGARSFATVFDLSKNTVSGEDGPWGTAMRRQHLHGCAVDSVWERLWLAVGDASGGAGVCAIIYSDDEGATWHSVPNSVSPLQNWQCVIPFSLPGSVVFCSDFDANGLRRIGRAGPQKMSEFGAAHLVDFGPSIQLIGMHAYQAPGVPNAPALFSFAGVGAHYPGAIAASLDGGSTFHTLYKDPNVGSDSLNYKGISGSFGPTNTGRYVSVFTDASRFPGGARMVSDLAVPKPGGQP